MPLPPIQLLGPQRFRPTVADALGAERGSLAVVTAGWQERENEIEELEAHVGRTAVNLQLYQRGEDVFQRDPELHAAHRARQDRLRELQEIYRIRLEAAKAAARSLFERDGDPALLEPEREAAIETLRTLDAHHLARIAELRAEYEARHRPRERAAVVRHRREIGAILEGSAALLIAGGHVAVLLNRLRLFEIASLVARTPVIAWSAGAMALGERVVVFHDFPPQGAGMVEVLDAGLGVHAGLLPFPHARRRLDLADPVRAALIAKRFAPALCVALDDGARVAWDGRRWRPRKGLLRLTERGQIVAMEAA